MARLTTLIAIFISWFCVANAAVLKDNATYSGLYGPEHKVEILTKANFDIIYGKPYSWLIEFYNTYCGFCIKYSSIFKVFAADVYFWRPIVRVGVIDCSDDANNDICRDFEILRYPTMRYFHSGYDKDSKKLGEELIAGPTPETMRNILLKKLREDEVSGLKVGWPKLSFYSYENSSQVIEEIPSQTKVTFFICDIENSTVCPEVVLDTNDYQNVVVKCMLSKSQLCVKMSPTQLPSLYALKPSLNVTPLTPKNNTRVNFVDTINTFMRNNELALPTRDYHVNDIVEQTTAPAVADYSDTIFQSDLEASLRFALTHEVSAAKVVTGEARLALIEFLSVLVDLFPFAENGRAYIKNLKQTIESENTWSGSQLKKMIHEKEQDHAPVYGSKAEWIGCKGSSPHYRGYTCGLWQIFHTLTVSAANNDGDGPRVLRAMHGYIKNFLGCYDCQQHFLAMSAKNKLFEVNDNKKAVLWLWVSHNEVNLRLEGDGSEDPHHPKVQFPTVKQCPGCRDSTKAWYLPEVYAYLRMIYGTAIVKENSSRQGLSSGPFDKTDVGLLSILYIISFIILLLVGNYFFSRRLKKRPYFIRSKV